MYCALQRLLSVFSIDSRRTPEHTLCFTKSTWPASSKAVLGKQCRISHLSEISLSPIVASATAKAVSGYGLHH